MSLFSNRSVPAHLRHSELGQALPNAELRQLNRIGTIVNISDGGTIIAESTVGRECFIVVDGEFTVSGPNITGEVGAGDIAGELALLTGKRRNASVVASADAAVYALHPREFVTLLSEAPQFRAKVLETATGRLGGETVTLPAQFVRQNEPEPDAWSGRLATLPAWGTPS